MAEDSGSICKVDRSAMKWELTELDDRLRERREAGASLRDLETFCNESILRAAMQTEDMDTLDGEASNLYRLLTDDDISPGKRIDAESRLERNGLDPSIITGDFISYQTMRTHLNECLGMETGRENTLSIEAARRTVLKLVSRTESVTKQTLDRLSKQGSLSIQSPSVTLSLRVACGECGEDLPFTQFLDRGGCACPEETDGET